MRVFLIDADNLSSPGWVDEAFKALETAEGSIAVRRAYGSAENLKGLADTLRTWAIRPFVNQSLSKNTTDIALAADAMAFACQQPTPAMIVIGSGDADFVPLVVRLRERGIQVVCVTEASKMAPEAVPAYDRVLYVGHAASARRSSPVPAPAAAPAKARRAAPAVA
ncbi:MAG: NYN domain-containing protein, partial [Hydrogenophaga sp.]|nr:NYN domain-containing protein [Hydrogenophaga sp.]